MPARLVAWPMAYVIDPAFCINCGWCRERCPTRAVVGPVGHTIDPRWCIDCDLCAQVCPVSCIVHYPEQRPPTVQLEQAKQRARDFARARRVTARRSIPPPPWMRPRSRERDVAT